LHACVHGGRKEFFQGGSLVDLSKRFSSEGAKSGEICFLPLETKKAAFLLKFSNSFPLSDTHVYVQENVRATPLNSWCNFERVNTILDSEILLNLIHRMKHLTDQFQLCFCFCCGKTKWLYFICALATQLASLYKQLASCYMCFVWSLHSGI